VCRLPVARAAIKTQGEIRLPSNSLVRKKSPPEEPGSLLLDAGASWLCTGRFSQETCTVLHKRAIAKPPAVRSKSYKKMMLIEELAPNRKKTARGAAPRASGFHPGNGPAPSSFFHCQPPVAVRSVFLANRAQFCTNAPSPNHLRAVHRASGPLTQLVFSPLPYPCLSVFIRGQQVSPIAPLPAAGACTFRAFLAIRAQSCTNAAAPHIPYTGVNSYQTMLLIKNRLRTVKDLMALQSRDSAPPPSSFFPLPYPP
jgi:hypothetical protein